MALTVGTDTYISVTDASTYVTDHYITTEATAVAWAALSDGNKAIVLRRAYTTLDRQPFVGIKAVSTQTQEFPRAILSDLHRRDLPVLNVAFSSDWYVQTSVPDVVKYAQVEIALQLAVGTPKRVELQRQGVKSFSLGKLSENYGGGTQNRIISQEARELLAPYLAGSVAIV
jgi:hypothetical protein